MFVEEILQGRRDVVRVVMSFGMLVVVPIMAVVVMMGHDSR